MSTPHGELTYWQSIAVAADQGQLFLNADAARACSNACDAFIEKLKDHQDSAKMLVNVSGWGEFESGKQLQTIFSEKASGGANNMVDVLQSHIDVVEEMKVVFQKFFVATEATDDSNAQDVGIHGPR